jgi:predicted lipoprotein with Yx(FWY)xxD motif
MSTHRTKIVAGGTLLSVLATSAGLALAGSTTPTVKARANTTLGKTVVVDAHSRTLYRLSGETRTKLKCTSATCLGAWPPLTVTSATTKLVAGTGVHGKLTLLHRAKGVLQVMLAGKPLYRFAGDKAPGTATGNGLQSFGGTWNVLSATGAATTPTPTATAPTTTPPPPPPSYPAY